jgi:hypothetical protein
VGDFRCRANADAGYHGLTMFPGIPAHRRACILLALAALVLPALAKDAPLQVIDWPETGTPVLRFSFSKFKQLPSMGALHGYVMDTTAENLSNRVIPSARFSIYLFDKNKVRVGEDAISVTNVGPGETVKFETTVSTSGLPVSITLHEILASAKTVSLTVNSTPQGAMLSLDGNQQGTTPRMITVGAGRHTLSFTKEGFNTGTFPLEISRDDVSGGTVNFELGAASYDSIELRDGSVLNGDLVSISGMDVEIRVGGNIQHIDRNKVKRVMFVQREMPKPDPLPAPQTN